MASPAAAPRSMATIGPGALVASSSPNTVRYPATAPAPARATSTHTHTHTRTHSHSHSHSHSLASRPRTSTSTCTRTSTNPPGHSPTPTPTPSSSAKNSTSANWATPPSRTPSSSAPDNKTYASPPSPSPSPSQSYFTCAPVPASQQPSQDGNPLFASAALSRAPTNTASTAASSAPLSSSPRRVPVDLLTNPIPETAGDETASESANEPLTPVSGRQSRDFYTIAHCDSTGHAPSEVSSQDIAYSEIPEDSGLPVHHVTSHTKPPLVLEPSPTPPETLPHVLRLQPPALRTAKSLNCLPVFTNSGSRTTPTAASPALASPLQDPPSAPPRRQTNGGNGSSLTRKPSRLYRMASFFRRSTSNVPELDSPPDSTAGATPVGMRTPASSSTPRRFSLHRSTATTRSNTPPSPSSPVEAKGDGLHPPMASSVPSASDFLNKKARANTGFSFRGRVNFAVNHRKEAPRRTRSVERNKKPRGDVHLTPQPWALAPDVGTGMKARRLSLSLPDDFNVDVIDLMRDYEYQHKLLGRHGKHLGKGATSKVALMARKGSPTELYAVKEFRGRKKGETADDYEKKIKSEYSIAKSLHHPNIVETISLCTHHGRWNHVMEYCAEGDLFGLVLKNYLNDSQRESDRLCLFKQLIQGVNYLHSNGIAHRDIKLENLLITKDSKLKITDFGVSEVFSGIHPGLRESGGECGRAMGEVRLCKPAICGSLPYIAPEVLSKKADYDPRALDVWSSAIVMNYLIFGGNLWERAEVDLNGNNKSSSQYNALVRGWEGLDRARAETPDSHENSYPHIAAFERYVKPLALRKILLNMLHPDPEKRMTIAQVANHRFTKGIECCQREYHEGLSVTIDASKADCMKNASNVQFCHNHLPPQNRGGGLPPMPGKAGY